MKEKYASRGGNALRGLLAGSLILGVVNPYEIPVLMVLFIAGLAILLDALLLFGKNIHPATTSFMALIGAIFSVIFSVAGYAHFYLAIIFLVTALLYVQAFLAREKTVKHEEKEE
jgi:uncharacterized membrane protein